MSKLWHWLDRAAVMMDDAVLMMPCTRVTELRNHVLQLWPGLENDSREEVERATDNTPREQQSSLHFAHLSFLSLS